MIRDDRPRAEQLATQRGEPEIETPPSRNHGPHGTALAARAARARRFAATAGESGCRGILEGRMRTRKPQVYTPLESEVQRNGILLLEALGWECHRRNTGVFLLRHNGKERMVRASEPGMADTWGTMPDGRRFEAEVKRYGKRPTPKQLTWLKSQNGPHCAAFWYDNTKTLNAVANALMHGAHIRYHETGDDYDVDF